MSAAADRTAGVDAHMPASEMFSAQQYNDAYPDGIERHWWMRARSAIVAAVIRECAPSRAGVLEVGCGRGAAVLGLRAAGIGCQGVELADVAPLPAVAAHVTVATDALALPFDWRQGIDTLLLLDVLEHLQDPQGFLRALAQGFPKLRRVIVTVPAGPSLWSNYDKYYGHQRRYRRAGLRELAADLGWRIPLCRHFFHTLFAPAWVQSRLGLARPVRLRAPGAATNGLHHMLAWAMRWDYRCLPGALPGTSAIACLELPEPAVSPPAHG